MKGSQSAHTDCGIGRLSLGLFGSTYASKANGSLTLLFLIDVMFRESSWGFFFFP